MDTGKSIISRVLRRVMCLLHPGIKHLLRCGCKTVYDAIEDLWNAVIETQHVVNKNADEMEGFSAELKEWASNFQAEIIALLSGGGTPDDPFGVIGWESLNKELRDKINEGLIKGGKIEEDANGVWWLRLQTNSFAKDTISIQFPEGFNAGEGGGFNPSELLYNFNSSAEDCTLTFGEHEVCVLPYANGIEGGSDDLEPTAGIMRASQAKKLDNFYIEGNILHYGGREFRLEYLKNEVSREYSDVVISKLSLSGISGTTIPYSGGEYPIIVEYTQNETVNYDDGSKDTNVIRSGATIEYNVQNAEVSGVSIYQDGRVVFGQNTTGETRTVFVSARVIINNKEAIKVLTLKQSVKPVSDVVYYGATPAYPQSESELVDKKTLPLTNNLLTIEQNQNGGKCQWVALPSTYSIKSWKNEMDYPVEWNTDTPKITKDGVSYSIFYFSNVIPPSKTIVEIVKK